MITFNFANVWVPSFWTYAICAMIYGIASTAYWGVAIVTGLELVHPSKRELAGISINYMWIIGEFILAGLSYWLRNWRDLQLALSVPFAFFSVYYFLLDESPRWLLAKGRNKEAQDIIRKIAKRNKVKLTEDEVQSVYDPIDPSESVSMLTSCRHVFASRRIISWASDKYCLLRNITQYWITRRKYLCKLLFILLCGVDREHYMPYTTE